MCVYIALVSGYEVLSPHGDILCSNTSIAFSVSEMTALL